MPTLERNFVFYRFSSDVTAVEKMEFDGREISVGDLKQAIADAKGLSKFDLVIENEATSQPYVRDGQMISRNANVIVRRMPPVNPKKGSVIGVVLNDIWSADAVIEIGSDDEDDRPAMPVQDCPPEYLCPLCDNVYQQPRIAKCCGRSACTKCFEEHLDCPLCKADWDMEYTEETVLNRRLAESVNNLNLEYFRLPGQSKGDSGEPDPAKIELKDEEKTKLEMKEESSGQILALENGGVEGVPPGGGAPTRMLPPEEFFAWQQALKAQKAEKAEKKAKKKEKKEKEKALPPEERAKIKEDKKEKKEQKKRKREEETSGSKAGDPGGLAIEAEPISPAMEAEPPTKAAAHVLGSSTDSDPGSGRAGPGLEMETEPAPHAAHVAGPTTDSSSGPGQAAPGNDAANPA